MRKSRRVSSYRLHKPSGQAVVRLDGKDHYLGKFGSEASREQYHRVIAEWLASHKQGCSTNKQNQNLDITINELILAYIRHAKDYYRRPDGTMTGEVDNLKHALRPVRQMYGNTLSTTFGPLALRSVQEEMIQNGLCRRVINDRIKRIRRAFRWAASIELISADIVRALETVQPLRRGRCQARESEGVKPIKWQDVDATLPFMPRQVAAMVQIMRYSNCRAQDVVGMRGCDINMSDNVWEYRPAQHKNTWREDDSQVHQRVVYLGPKCQEIIQPFLKPYSETYLFSPKESRAEHENRRTTRNHSKVAGEQAPKRSQKTARKIGERYSVNTFQQAVRRACRKAGVPAWTVLAVRHTRATEVRERYGIEGAAASLGDTVEAAQIYAERNEQLAKTIAKETG